MKRMGKYSFFFYLIERNHGFVLHNKISGLELTKSSRHIHDDTHKKAKNFFEK